MTINCGPNPVTIGVTTKVISSGETTTADNGAIALSYLPLAGSPAIDAGDNTGCPSFDQRGYPRPIGAACDIGSVEAGSALWLPALRRVPSP